MGANDVGPALKSGAMAILDSVLAHGVDTIFGLPGGQLDHFFDAMYHRSDQLQLVGSRHEQGAAYMAFGYAKSTGRVGTYTVVPGPGVLNTTAALCSAYANNSPVLCITGQIPSHGLGKGVGFLHELPDQLATMRTLTKWSERIMSPEEAPAIVDEAFAQLTGGRPRPVSLEMPMDTMGAEAEVPAPSAPAARLNPAIDEDSISAAAKLLTGSKRPMILVGGGAIGATAEINALAEMVQAPVVSFRNGRGIVSDRSAFGQVFPAGYELWKTADVALAIGTRMEQQYLYWGVDDDLDVIRIDIDDEEITRIAEPDISLHADAQEAVAALLDALPKVLDNRDNREDELLDLKARTEAAIEADIQPQAAWLGAIRTALPDDGYMVDEITQVGFASWYGFPVYEPRHLITCGYQGTLGYGLATALGVKVAHPDKAVVSIAGDGGFMFNVQELATAAQHKIGVVFVLFNNNQFGNVQRQQKEWFGGRIINSDLQNPDFVALAESFGIKGVRATSPDALIREMTAGFESGAPTLIEVPVGDMAAPWKYIIRPPARGESVPL